MILITIIEIDFNRIKLHIYKYDSDSNVPQTAIPNFVISSLPDTLPPSACACAAYINVVDKTKTTNKKTTKEEKQAIF